MTAIPSRRRLFPPTRRQVRAALGVLWLVDAALQAQPALFTAAWWRTDLSQSVMGEPMVINHSIFWAVNLIAAHAAVWNSLFIAIQVVIGVALLLGRWERVAILASIPWALGIWWVGEGFGTLPSGFAIAAAGSPGPVLFYPLIAVLAWPQKMKEGVVSPKRVAASAVGERAGAIAWLVLWAGQALLQIPWSLPPGQVLVANVQEHSLDQPSWVAATARLAEGLARNHPLALTVTLAFAQVVIGAGILFPRARRGALRAGIGLSLVFWLSFQGLGGLAGGGTTDPGAAPLMILLALSLWPMEPAKLDFGVQSAPVGQDLSWIRMVR
jgi:hypothetical protein